MDLRYEAFCFADRRFYDLQSSTESDLPGDDFSRELPELPADWVQVERNVWRHLHPAGVQLPKQGWKIHVSAGLDNASKVLKATFDYCVERRIPFKYLPTISVVLARNSKYAPREGSGKLITIYPTGTEQLEQILTELSATLEGEHGAYILSDLRYGKGPLYVRYGGFSEQWLEQDGQQVLAIEGPDGTLIPDKRKPVFSVPEWVQLPEFLAPHLAERNAGDPEQFPYRIKSSLHFSNGGGVYLAARKSDGKEVVLKEARPHAGLDREGRDAVARLEREYEILSRLRGVKGVPEVYDRFVEWEHLFVAMEFMPGRSLGQWLGMNYPLTHRDPTPEQLAEYKTRALALVAKVEDLMTRVHERGVVFGDLHTLNVLVDENDEVSLIDFELSSTIEDVHRPTLGAPGFQAPPDREGFEIDEHPLAALKLWIFLPLNTVLELAPAKLPQHVQVVKERFGLSDEYGQSIIDVLTPRVDPPTGPSFTEFDDPEPDWSVIRKSIATAILHSATPERSDRLFPGDIEQFEVGGTCFAYGAAGVLHALDVSGEGRYPEHEDWLIRRVRQDPPKQPGFFVGAHGIAHVLENFGHHDVATELVEGYAELLPATKDHGLSAGLSGIGLNLLHFATTRHDDSFTTRAEELAERLAAQLADAPGPGDKAKAGLLHGWSGPALFFLRMFEHTTDQRWLDLAERALERDLAETMVALDGSLQVRDGTFRSLPYVGIGGAGIALVLTEFAAVAPDRPCVEKLPELLSGCTGEFVIQPALTLGRAGLMATLAHATRQRPDERLERSVRQHLRALGWHAVHYGGGLAFPGVQLRRLSMDLNTGGAGVLLAIASTVDGRPPLPFLGRAQTPVHSGR
ncbi:class III lanthionine synthetase LanKC [Lentzea flava]|uniref:non-specific serine/threonine protein kinase n=1 Tax=Lentzea flava TaxID=103732 RepID=A0ABQ2VBZ8_9PSEU|nr:class III lanthionine synthetase LanKC [Lentzea flava]MCP2200653.1 Lanthionine synthetase C-like protein [Lentzea flava]GGU77622.1 serine/threonine protein kinase [Lentzea flava]